MLGELSENGQDKGSGEQGVRNGRGDGKQELNGKGKNKMEHASITAAHVKTTETLIICEQWWAPV